jgi:hypothetical protein
MARRHPGRSLRGLSDAALQAPRQALADRAVPIDNALVEPRIEPWKAVDDGAGTAQGPRKDGAKQTADAAGRAPASAA